MAYGLWTCLGGVTGCAISHQSLHVVAVPVADLRARPGSLATSNAHDPLQETQLLYGERVKLIKTEGAWALVEALEQPEYTHHHRWEGYPGWTLVDLLRPLPRSSKPTAIVTAKWATIWQDAGGLDPFFQVPMGTTLRVTRTDGARWPVQLLSGVPVWISRADVRLMREFAQLTDARRRELIVRAAEALLGDPYFWGGRSPHADPGGLRVTGVDCSGVVNLAYRTAGIEIPRDAHEQYLRARMIAHPQAADLVFLSEAGHPQNIVHVMLYAGGGWLLEGPGTGQPIRRILVAERFGRPLETLKPGEQINRQTLFFGAFLR